MRLLHRMVRAVASTNKPVIAAVRGVCIGVSWSMALASDFIIAAEDARFQFAFRHIGLAPDGGAAFLLTRYIGIQRAKELMYSGRFVNGLEAKQLGLALETLTADEVLPRAIDMARGFAAAPTISLTMMKRQFDAAPAQKGNDIEQQRARFREAYTLAEQYETNPRSVWGYVQGLTRLSQHTPWQDGRFALDRAASRLLTTVH